MTQKDTRNAQPLPDGWVWMTLEEACQVNPRMTRPEGFTDSTLVSFVPMAAVDDVSGAIVDAQVRPLDEVWKGYKRFAENDVIFAKITPCMENGKCAIAKGLLNGIGLGSTEFHVLRASGAVTPQWIYHFVRQESFRADAAAKMTGTAGQLRVPTGFMQEATVPLAPLPEQHRIVTEIETQFTRLEAGVAALKRAQANLRRYKASVLKAACEGRLVPTEAELARVEGREYEPAEVLLERILTERRAKWQTENPAKKYKEPNPPDTSGQPELPEGWVWASVEQVCERIVDCLHSTAKFQESGFMCVDTNCIEPGRIVLKRVRYVDEETFIKRNRRMKPMENDVLFSREGALLGIATVVPANLEICLGQRMMVFRLPRELKAKYYETVLNSPVFRAQYVRHITGTASPHLNIRDIRLLGIPIPPHAEQERIAAEVERRLSVVAELEKQVEAALRRAERLRQAILKHAFEGRLVPQDPEDEPASALLARIRAPRP